MKIESIATASLLGNIAFLQGIQYANQPDSPAWKQASEILQIFFEEMKRRTIHEGPNRKEHE